MNRIHSNSIGLVTGGILALAHAVWASLVWLGYAQPVLDFVFRLHMMNSPFQVQPFQLGLAIGLVAFTGCVGFTIGAAFAALLNFFAGRELRRLREHHPRVVTP